MKTARFLYWGVAHCA